MVLKISNRKDRIIGGLAPNCRFGTDLLTLVFTLLNQEVIGLRQHGGGLDSADIRILKAVWLVSLVWEFFRATQSGLVLGAGDEVSVRSEISQIVSRSELWLDITVNFEQMSRRLLHLQI